MGTQATVRQCVRCFRSDREIECTVVVGESEQRLWSTAPSSSADMVAVVICEPVLEAAADHDDGEVLADAGDAG